MPNTKQIILLIALMLLACQPKQEAKPSQSALTVKDFIGQTLTFEQKPQRVISLAPNVTELIYALSAEDKLIGVSSYCNYPPDARTKPVLGGFSATDINIEAILAAKPDLVIASPTQKTALVEQFNSLGIPLFAFSPRNILDVLNGMQRLGTVLDRQARADSLVSTLKAEISEMQTFRNHFAPKTVFLEISATPLMTATTESFVGQVLMLAGGINIAGDLEGEYPQINPELILQENPDVIIIAHDGVTAAEVAQRPGWDQLYAVQTGNVYTDLNHDLIFRAGPRLMDGAREFFRCIYPEHADQLESAR